MFVSWRKNSNYECFLMKSLGNFNGKYFGDVPDCREILTFDLELLGRRLLSSSLLDDIPGFCCFVYTESVSLPNQRRQDIDLFVIMS